MLNNLGVIQVGPRTARTDPTFGRKLGGKSLLEIVVRRMTDCQRLDAVVVVLATPDVDNCIRLLVPPDVPTWTSNQPDPLARLVDTLDHFRARSVVRVSADNPFIDPVLVDRLVSTADTHPNCDYISYCSADGRPAILTHLGLCAEWCSGEALRRAGHEARRASDRDAVTSFLYSHPELFNVRLIPLPAELDRDDVRLKIDFEEDWEHAQAIYEALGPDEWDWRRVADLLDHQPALRRPLAVLNRSAA